ncbi:hypothetical protein GCM10029964_055970 [Kibdelosporangium lantanae]
MNQDGASNGLTAPNGPSQQRVIRAALANAGLVPADVDVVDGHGTGTVLGDPIEAQALLATYGQGRVEPLWLGSVKSNIGHAQAAAGIAGVIKMVEAMRRGVAPRSLHVDKPSSHVDWKSGAVALLAEPRPWPEAGRSRRAAVSSFGISGTNAHVILEHVPDEAVLATESKNDVQVPLTLALRGEAALRAQEHRLSAWLAGQPDAGLVNAAWTLASRSQWEHRSVVVAHAGMKSDVLDRGAVVRGQVIPGRTVFVFPGQGSQWVGMGRGLWDVSDAFRERLVECDRALAPLVGFSVVEVVRAGLGLERVEVVQPVLFAVMVALADVWADAGVVPDVVVGHSQGEVAAACGPGCCRWRTLRGW